MKNVAMKANPFCLNASQNHGIETAAVMAAPERMCHRCKTPPLFTQQPRRRARCPQPRSRATGPLASTPRPRKPHVARPTFQAAAHRRQGRRKQRKCQRQAGRDWHVGRCAAPESQPPPRWSGRSPPPGVRPGVTRVSAPSQRMANRAASKVARAPFPARAVYSLTPNRE